MSFIAVNVLPLSLLDAIICIQRCECNLIFHFACFCNNLWLSYVTYRNLPVLRPAFLCISGRQDWPTTPLRHWVEKIGLIRLLTTWNSPADCHSMKINKNPLGLKGKRLPKRAPQVRKSHLNWPTWHGEIRHKANINFVLIYCPPKSAGWLVSWETSTSKLTRPQM